MHQAAIEDIFLDSMQKAGVTVDRNMFPTAIALSDDDAVLSDPSAYAVKVWVTPKRVRLRANT